MSLEVNKPNVPQKTFVLNRALHLDKNNKAVEEDDPAGVRVLGGEGSSFYEEEAKGYGLDDSHRKAEDKPAEEDKGLIINPEPAKDEPPTEPAPEHKKTAAEKKADKKAEADQ